MADITRLTPHQPFELEQLREEAVHRWFRPPEICEILRNHSNCNVHSQPPLRPSAGSLFLFDRKVLRYFRKDGYNWKKKKDGKTINEAHEKLKVSGVDALHCYYAHGEDNHNFQRRIYWLLDTRLEHIVLVHYRQVNEGHKIGLSSLLTTKKDPGSQLVNPWSEKPSPYVQASYAYNPIAVDWNEHRLDSSGCHGYASTVDLVQASVTVTALLPGDNGPGLSMHNFDPGLIDGSYISSTSSFWADDDVHRSSKTLGIIKKQKLHFDLQNVKSDRDVAQLVSRTGITKLVELKKLDSFGRWMDKEIGKDCDDSLMVSDSADCWKELDDKEVSSLSRHVQLDSNSVDPSLSQEQLFTISDVAPDWAYSGTETKVLIMGNFLVDKKALDGKWCCMFGETEISCDVLSENVIRCRVPPHASGCVPFYVTCGNQLACSEVREFEFRENPSRFESMKKFNNKTAPEEGEEEVSMQIRLAKLLCLGRSERKWLDCSAVECEKCKVKKTKLCNLMEKSVDEVRIARKNYFCKETVIQDLLKDKLYEWLVCKAHQEDEHVFDDEGQGVIHLTASLGYVWALGPIISVSVISPNFRDKQGRTSLHWASYFGREEAVITLMKLGAAAGAVDDPTPEYPGGRKAADVASDRGHKGIAGYLAKADLTSHLHSLSVVTDNDDLLVGTSDQRTPGAEEFVPRVDSGMLDDMSLKGSLAAVRKSAQAAAMIQAAFRAHSFRLRQQTSTAAECSNDDGVLSSVALGSSNKHKVGHVDEYLHSAAIKIQRKCRGWKARKEFLRIRKRIVRIQAHVRGHQVCKQYKKVIWSVSVVEKAILRWRRKKPGLRGFRTENEHIDDEYEYLRVTRKLKVAGVEKALARVQSMVRHPEARDQYMRLVRLEAVKLTNDDGTRS